MSLPPGGGREKQGEGGEEKLKYKSIGRYIGKYRYYLYSVVRDAARRSGYAQSDNPDRELIAHRRRY